MNVDTLPPDEDNYPLEPSMEKIIFINPDKDVFKAQVVIGPAPATFYQEKMIKDLVAQIMKQIPPTPIEKNGYEILSYKLIIKKYENS